jgi:ribonuclease HI
MCLWCRVPLDGLEKEWWSGTELGLLRAYQFPGHVTASDGSVGTGSRGAGFVWLDRSKDGSERVGREEEGASSGRVEIGAYAAILRRTPDHEDLLTATDSEVLCRLVDRWVGQGGKASLANTADADILEYILAKLAARIEAKARTFVVKVKAHRGEPLNEGADDLAEVGRTLKKEGRGLQMDTEDNSPGVLILRQDLEPIEERYMEQDHSERSKEGHRGIST